MPQKIDPNLTRICKICGEAFHPTARKQYCCNRPCEKTCVICGKPFTVLCNTDYLSKQTCSPSCSAKLRKLTLANNASTTAKHFNLCPECLNGAIKFLISKNEEKMTTEETEYKEIEAARCSRLKNWAIINNMRGYYRYVIAA